MENRELLKFGSYGLDTVAKVLLKDGEPVHLTRKAAETLQILADRSPQVVTKEEIIEAVWGDRVVDEANLTQNIAVVRKALGAAKGEAAYIETFPGRGYRLHGPVVRQLVETSHAVAAPAPVVEAVREAPAGRPRWPWAAAVLLSAALAVSLYLLTRQQETPPALHVTPVTRLTGQELQPVLSPDGARLAFVWQQDERAPFAVFVQSLTEASARRLSPLPGATATSYSSPAWAPDGTSIACLRFGSSSAEVVILPVDGGPVRVVTPVLPTRYGLSATHIDWSPDGRSLAIDDSPSFSQPLSLFLVDLATGAKTRLTQPEEMFIGDVAPKFSPDGRTLSFIRTAHRSRQDVYTVPVTGGTPRQVTSDARQIAAQDWDRDGRTLIFSSTRGGESRIYRIQPGQAPLSTNVYAEFPMQFSYARRTSTLVYSILHNDPNIWRLELGGEPRWQRIAASSGQDASPQYSPDGRRIAFRSDRSGEEQIWVCDADGGNAVQVTSGPGRPSVPRWSPDATTLVFNDNASTELFLATEQGGAWQVRSFGARGVHPVYSPDGRSIYAAGTGSIYRFPAGGGAAETLSPTRALSLGISGDGRWLYFVREPADTALSRLELASGRVERFLEGLVPYCTSCWALAPDGIYYLAARPQAPSQQSIFFLDFATNGKRLVADYPEPILPIGIGPFSLSPDRKSLLVVRLDPASSDILRVDGFR